MPWSATDAKLYSLGFQPARTCDKVLAGIARVVEHWHRRAGGDAVSAIRSPSRKDSSVRSDESIVDAVHLGAVVRRVLPKNKRCPHRAVSQEAELAPKPPRQKGQERQGEYGDDPLHPDQIVVLPRQR